MRAIVFSLLLLSCPPAHAYQDAPQEEEASKLFRIMGLMNYGVKGADAMTTEVIIAQGGHERNPLWTNDATRRAAYVAGPFLVNWATDELRKTGHPKMALWIRIASVAASGYAIAHNLRQIR